MACGALEGVRALERSAQVSSRHAFLGVTVAEAYAPPESEP
jgi:hypothetical protein